MNLFQLSILLDSGKEKLLPLSYQIKKVKQKQCLLQN